MGDSMLRNTIGEFQRMHDLAKSNRDIMIPYLYEFYNIHHYTKLASDGGVESPTARMLNAFIEGINKRSRLPRYVIVMPDIDIIEEVDLFEPEAAMIKAFGTNNHMPSKADKFDCTKTQIGPG